MNENIADEIRKTIESIKDMKTQASGINNYLSTLEGLLRADIQKKVDEAYQIGYDKGYADKTNNDEVCEELAKDIYQRGLDDAWEAARKIVTWPDRSLVNSDTFDLDPGEGIFTKYSASEAIAKLKAYEEQKADDKIKVGDEVDWSGDKFIVTRIFQPYDKAEECDGVDMDGCVYHDVLISGLTKTGRHFDIADVLKGINWT